LVLELRLTGKCGYYFVNHTGQRRFWLEDYDFSWAAGEVHVGHSDSIIGMEMKRHYWRHNEYFPHLYEFMEKDLEEIDDMIGFTFGDVLTSDTSAVNGYNLEQLKYVTKMMTRHAQKAPRKRRKSVGERRTICECIIGYHEQFLNLHGERGARLDSKQSIYYSSMYQSSLLMNVLALLMFGGPHIHTKSLRDMASDWIVNKELLAKYTAGMVAEWRDVALYISPGTVLLGANVLFLAIQSVDEASTGPSKTPAQRASYFSILASLGTLASSLVLLIVSRHHDGARLNYPQSRWGLEALALVYSMPFGLVIWALLGFFASFIIMWADCQDTLMVKLVVGFCAIFAVFLGWVVASFYCDMDPYEKIAS
ncbi:hypothetical protein FA13DRAFT_1608016, partial [Coprinellus micaceus]